MKTERAMLQTFSNTLLPGQLTQAPLNTSDPALSEGETGMFSGVLVGILRDFNVLQEDLTLLEGQDLSLLENGILPQQVQQASETLPLDGNLMPLAAGEELLDGEVLNVPALNPQTLTAASLNGTVSEQAVESGQMMGLRAGSTVVSDTLQKNLASETKLNAPFASTARIPITPVEVLPQQTAVMDDGQPSQLLDLQLQQNGKNILELMSAQRNATKDVGDLFKTQLSASSPTASLGTNSPLGVVADKLAAPAQPLPQATVHTPVGQAGWDNEFGNRVNWMIKQNVPVAEIKLTPANLGPIEVKVAVNNDQATITMTAAHSSTREALETAMPRLRDMLQESGLTLADANVFSQHQEKGQGEQHLFDQLGEAGESESDDVASDESEVTTTTGVDLDRGVVDLFA